ncbi:MAG: ATP-binding protein [Proteobacteria bacterium]|nr:ATP-binding protein [Pseudomonadota bacterium]
MTAETDFTTIRGERRAIDAIVRAVGCASDLVLIVPHGGQASALARRVPTLWDLSDAHRRLQQAEYTHQNAPFPADTRPPFRAPHHTSHGHTLRAEARLARFGVLYLKDLLAFHCEVLAELRDVLGEMDAERPMVIATVAPCACHEHQPPLGECRCDGVMRRTYQARLAGACEGLRNPVTVRCDTLTAVARDGEPPAPSSSVLRQQVATWRAAHAASNQHRPYRGPWRATWLAIATRNPWLQRCWDPTVSESMHECHSAEELWLRFQRGNWALGTAFVLGDVCFINQVNGGDEWLVIRRGLAFESMTALLCFPDAASLARFCRAVVEADDEQLRRHEYDWRVPK